MDAESRGAARVLAALAASNEGLIALKRRLRENPEVTSVQQSLTLRDYQSGPVVEAFVDAELTSGRAVACWLEIHWGEAGWVVDYAVRVNHDGGEDVVRSFEPRRAKTIDDFVAQLEASVADLFRATETSDFAALSCS